MPPVNTVSAVAAVPSSMLIGPSQLAGRVNPSCVVGMVTLTDARHAAEYADVAILKISESLGAERRMS